MVRSCWNAQLTFTSRLCGRNWRAAGGSAEFIETVRSVGYRFRETEPDVK